MYKYIPIEEIINTHINESHLQKKNNKLLDPPLILHIPTWDETFFRKEPKKMPDGLAKELTYQLPNTRETTNSKLFQLITCLLSTYKVITLILERIDKFRTKSTQKKKKNEKISSS